MLVLVYETHADAVDMGKKNRKGEWIQLRVVQTLQRMPGGMVASVGVWQFLVSAHEIAP
jgi:hypothetical protein